MKAYFVFFNGSPAAHLKPLTLLDPDLAVVSISQSLHCVSFGSNVSESAVLNALELHSESVCLVPADLPIYPMPKGETARELMRMIGAAHEDDCAAMASG
jgi:hypothetical protein